MEMQEERYGCEDEHSVGIPVIHLTGLPNSYFEITPEFVLLTTCCDGLMLWEDETDQLLQALLDRKAAREASLREIS